MDEKTSSVISARLKELRTDLSLTQKEFAQKINASTVSISSYETEQKPHLWICLLKYQTHIMYLLVGFVD